VITGLAPEKASMEIPVQSVSEKLVLVAGLIPGLLCPGRPGISSRFQIGCTYYSSTKFESSRASIFASRVSLYVSCDPKGSILEFGPALVRARNVLGLI